MKILTNYNFNGNEIQNVKIQNLATAPDSPSKGQVYFNTTNNRLYVWNGTAWIGADANDAVLSGAQIVSAINGSASIIDDDNLSANVNTAIAKAHNTHAIADITGLQSALDGKVDDSQVLTNVPAGAVFTDTVTTINGKTGAIAKADIVALGIPAQDTTYTVFSTTVNGLVPMSDGASTKYLRADGAWVVPPNTIYTLPVAGASLGGVRSGTDITVDASGNVSVNDNSHNHTIANVTGLQTALDGKAASSHTHAIADVTGLQTALDGKSASTHNHTLDSLSNVTITSNATGEILKWSGTAWINNTLAEAGIAEVSHTHTIANVTGLQTALDGKESTSGATSKATTAENNAKAYTDTKIADLLSSAPSTLDTLNELAAALGGDPNFATTITNQIALKADKYSATVGNGVATSFVVTHNLNSRDVVITIRETASPYAQVITDVEMTTLDTVTVKFASAPTSGQYTITIIG